MTHENKSIGGGAEHPGSDEQKISEMLSTLKRVEAPKDFDFHLKARIANARPADYRKTSLFPILKYAMPLALFIIVGAAAVVISSYDSWQESSVAEVPDDSRTESPGAVVQQPSNLPVPDASPILVEERTGPQVADTPQLAAAPKRKNPPINTVAPVSKPTLPKPAGGSFDITGGNSRSENRCLPGIRCEPLKANEAFDRLGIEAEFEDDAWKVKSVKANGIADQLGVKSGDRIKEFDGKPIGEKTEFDNQLQVTTIKVVRNNETIDLRNNKPK